MKVIKILKKISFPSVKSWRNSIILFVFTHGTGLIFPIFYFLLLIALFCVHSLTFNPLALLVIFVAILSYCLLFICFLLAFIPYFIVSKICRFIFRNSVKLHNPELGSCKESDYFVVANIAIFSSLPFFLIQFVSAIRGYPLNQLLDAILHEIDWESIVIMALSPDKLLQFSWIWLIIAAYLYELAYLQKHKT